MSSRALKKLQRLQEQKQNEELDQEESEETTSEEENVGGPINKFDLLTLGSDDDDNEADIEKITGEEETDVIKHSTGARKKKKKRKGKNQVVKKITTEDEDDEIERSIREVNALLGEPTIYNAQSHGKKMARHLLAVEYKHLNPVNELKRRFGAKVVDEQIKKDRRKRQTTGQGNANLIIQKPARTLRHPMPAITMVKVGEENGYNKFKFKHMPAYQKVQAEFMKNLSSTNPEVLLRFTREHPFHVDTLLQISEMFRVTEDLSVAAELIERTIFVLESSFHPLFNITSAKCILDYKQQENRAFFIALFRRAINVSQRGCFRTALEFSKLILSLAPENDPLAVSLMMDYYALRCREYAWLYNLYNYYEPTKTLSMLPNFAFSVPLALYYLGNETRRKNSKFVHESINMTHEECRVKANEMIQDALIRFPAVLLLLLGECRVKPDPAVSSHPYFGPQEEMTKGLTNLVKLFVYRNFHAWKEPPVMAWLEENVRKAIERIDNGDPLAEKYKEKRMTSFTGMPLAIYRHLFMADVKGFTFELPQFVDSTGVMSYDPMPPVDSFCDYKITKPDQRVDDQFELVEHFVRSLLPTYDPNGDRTEQAERELRDRFRNILESFRNLFTRNLFDEAGNDGDEDTAN